MSMTVSDDFTKTADKPSCLGGHSIPVLNLTHYHTHMATDNTSASSPSIFTQIVTLNYL